MTYKTGDIVLVDTEDVCYGHVVVPAVVRYYNAPRDVYEVNALVSDGTTAADQRDLHWWTVTPNEITAKLGHASVERTDKSKCAQTFTVTRI